MKKYPKQPKRNSRIKGLPTKILSQTGVFESRSGNPNGHDNSKHIPEELLERALEAIGDRISLSPLLLAKRMGLEKNSANHTLCGHILRRLKWKNWNPNNTRGVWVKGDIEFD